MKTLLTIEFIIIDLKSLSVVYSGHSVIVLCLSNLSKIKWITSTQKFFLFVSLFVFSKVLSWNFS